MQKPVVLVSAAVAMLGLAAATLEFVAESAKSQAFVGFVEQRCVYRRTPALLALTGLALATSVAFGCLRRDATPATSRRRGVAVKLSAIAWVVVAVAVLMFLYGAVTNRGGTQGLSVSRRRWRYRYGRHGHGYYYGCTVLKSGFFATASVLSAVATGCAIAAYLYLQRADEPAPGQFVAPGVAMGQLQWAQPYPPPPAVANPAPPQDGRDGYGPRQPAGTA